MLFTASFFYFDTNLIRATWTVKLPENSFLFSSQVIGLSVINLAGRVLPDLTCEYQKFTLEPSFLVLTGFSVKLLMWKQNRGVQMCIFFICTGRGI